MQEEALKWQNGLLPAVAQDFYTGRVLMLAYMSPESLEKTLKSGYAVYFSRSRQKLWKKGETSGHLQKIKRISYDCDGDTLLLQVEQTGPACHTGKPSCFFNTMWQDESAAGAEELRKEWEVVLARKETPQEGSYTNYLFDKGVDKIAKKLGEEAVEVVIAAKNNDAKELVYETCDLIYHAAVLLASQGIEPARIFEELKKRRL